MALDEEKRTQIDQLIESNIFDNIDRLVTPGNIREVFKVLLNNAILTTEIDNSYDIITNKPTLTSGDDIEITGLSNTNVFEGTVNLDISTSVKNSLGKINTAMQKGVYDPNNIEGDAFSMGNMSESNNALILTSDERDKISNAALKSITITVGDGLTGGGDLTTNREISFSANTQNTLIKANTAVQPNDLGTLAKKNKISLIDIDNGVLITDNITASNNKNFITNNEKQLITSSDQLSKLLSEYLIEVGRGNLISNPTFKVNTDTGLIDQWTLNQDTQEYSQEITSGLGNSQQYTLWGGDSDITLKISSSDGKITINVLKSLVDSGYSVFMSKGKYDVTIDSINYKLPNPYKVFGFSGGDISSIGEDGKSAYQLAQEYYNFTGTIEEWLTSLKGPKGDKGDKGDSGITDDSNYAKLNTNNSFSGNISTDKIYGRITTINESSDISTRGLKSSIYTSGNGSHIYTGGNYQINTANSSIVKTAHIIAGRVSDENGGTASTTSDLSKYYTRKEAGRFIGDGEYITGRDIGMIAIFTSTTPGVGWLKLNGALLNRADYPALWEYASKSGMIVSDADWLDTTKQNWGKWSTGDGSTTAGLYFRVPMIGGEFIRVWDDNRGIDSNRVVGSYQGDAIRNITGSFGKPPYTNNSYAGIYEGNSANGSFYGENFTSYLRSINNLASVDIGTLLYPINYAFNASRQVPTASENRPRNIAYPYYVRFK